ncbi:MAG: hypothetical protein ABSG28_04945 [Methanoregula sp.]|uniref:hypothetical protein n=1 Tax=Methanoregula sp. TaxID=2052170 RepID=UPI003C1B9566
MSFFTAASCAGRGGDISEGSLSENLTEPLLRSWDAMLIMTPCDRCSLKDWHYYHPICMPSPKNIQGILISRDPTTDFIEPYKHYDHDKGLFQYKEAPPTWLYNRILSFMKYGSNSHESIYLRNFLNSNCYWTHFHKCPTLKGDKDFHFSYKHGKECAGFWFDYEYSTYNLNGKILILLGQDLKKYYDENPDNQLFKNNTVFFLPHPSGINMGSGWSWNPNKPEGDVYKKEIKKTIEELMSRVLIS